MDEKNRIEVSACADQKQELLKNLEQSRRGHMPLVA